MWTNHVIQIVNRHQRNSVIMNQYKLTFIIILALSLPLFIVIWIGNDITIYNSEDLPIDILGTNQSHPSSLSPISTAMSMMERGDIAMGFNQNKIVHNFNSTTNGGTIMITALNTNDAVTIQQIKNHTLDIQKDFLKGNFSKPFFIHAEEVPGTKVMNEKKGLINYSIQNLRNGSILILDTRDDEVINAIHQFMNYQGNQHHGH
jgi:hypothetical protein